MKKILVVIGLIGLFGALPEKSQAEIRTYRMQSFRMDPPSQPRKLSIVAEGTIVQNGPNSHIDLTFTMDDTLLVNLPSNATVTGRVKTSVYTVETDSISFFHSGSADIEYTIKVGESVYSYTLNKPFTMYAISAWNGSGYSKEMLQGAFSLDIGDIRSHDGILLRHRNNNWWSGSFEAKLVSTTGEKIKPREGFRSALRGFFR